MKDYANPQLLVAPAELNGMLGAPGLHIVDCRPTEAYVAGHLPGAVHADLYGLNLCDSDPAPLRAFLWMIAYLFGIKGIDQSQTVVLYDDTTDWRVARTWWLLDVFGHARARVLNGGFNAWARGEFGVSTEAIAPIRTAFQASPQVRGLASYHDVLASLDRTGTRRVDTRNRDEFLGRDVQAARGGAIPGAVWVDYLQNLTAEGTFRPAAELESLYAGAGVRRDQDVITYCQGGYRGAHSYLALRLLGYPSVRNYIGSWKEWGDRPELPVEIPQDGD